MSKTIGIWSVTTDISRRYDEWYLFRPVKLSDYEWLSVVDDDIILTDKEHDFMDNFIDFEVIDYINPFDDAVTIEARLIRADLIECLHHSYINSEEWEKYVSFYGELVYTQEQFEYFKKYVLNIVPQFLQDLEELPKSWFIDFG